MLKTNELYVYVINLFTFCLCFYCIIYIMSIYEFLYYILHYLKKMVILTIKWNFVLQEETKKLLHYLILQN